MESTDCAKAPASTLVFGCSGAADVGEVADQAARDISRKGLAKAFRTVGLGGKVTPIIETTRAASTILAIDGCPLDCTKRSLAEAGFSDCLHFRVTDLGMPKGETAVSAEGIAKVVSKAGEVLATAQGRKE